MRRILQRELAEAFRRRGLRNRAWAVEWSEDAVEFLLAEGFTPDLGARPLRRAIEHHLLAPLAVATVNRQVPSGDQFLFVRSDGKGLRVEFVDPDQPAGEDTPAAAPVEGSEAAEEPAAPSLRRIALQARGDAEELALLRRRCEQLSARLEAPAWREKKEIALSMTALPNFWSSPERWAILSQAESLDRIDVGARTARSLLGRLDGDGGRRRRAAPELVRRLAVQLHLVEHAVAAFEAGRGWDAFLQVETGGGSESAETASFAAELGGMYRGWADRRRMRHLVLEERPNANKAYRLVLAVSGFAAFDLLADEDGYHVLEIPKGESGDRGGFDRLQARVRWRRSRPPRQLRPRRSSPRPASRSQRAAPRCREWCGAIAAGRRRSCATACAAGARVGSTSFSAATST